MIRTRFYMNGQACSPYLRQRGCFCVYDKFVEYNFTRSGLVCVVVKDSPATKWNYSEACLIPGYPFSLEGIGELVLLRQPTI